MEQADQAYPVQLEIDYPDESRDRLTTFFRIILVIPILIVVGFLVGPDASPDAGFAAGTAGFLFLASLLMILFRQKYPRWWFDWNIAILNFSLRIETYFLLLRDEYPSTDEEQAVHLQISYPDVEADLNRWLPLIKWLLAIPHFIVLIFLGLAALVVTVIAWFAILFTGYYPRGMFGFVVDVMRWPTRVTAYAILLTTDRYPPFRMGA